MLNFPVRVIATVATSFAALAFAKVVLLVSVSTCIIMRWRNGTNADNVVTAGGGSNVILIDDAISIRDVRIDISVYEVVEGDLHEIDYRYNMRRNGKEVCEKEMQPLYTRQANY